MKQSIIRVHLSDLFFDIFRICINPFYPKKYKVTWLQLRCRSYKILYYLVECKVLSYRKDVQTHAAYPEASKYDIDLNELPY